MDAGRSSTALVVDPVSDGGSRRTPRPVPGVRPRVPPVDVDRTTPTRPPHPRRPGGSRCACASGPHAGSSTTPPAAAPPAVTTSHPARVSSSPADDSPSRASGRRTAGWSARATCTSTASSRCSRGNVMESSPTCAQRSPPRRSVFGGEARTRVVEADGEPGQWYLHLLDAGGEAAPTSSAPMSDQEGVHELHRAAPRCTAPATRPGSGRGAGAAGGVRRGRRGGAGDDHRGRRRARAGGPGGGARGAVPRRARGADQRGAGGAGRRTGPAAGHHRLDAAPLVRRSDVHPPRAARGPGDDPGRATGGGGASVRAYTAPWTPASEGGRADPDRCAPTGSRPPLTRIVRHVPAGERT